MSPAGRSPIEFDITQGPAFPNDAVLLTRISEESQDEGVVTMNFR